MLNDVIAVVSSATGEKKGLRITQKVIKSGFSEFIDVKHLTLEQYTLGNTTFSTNRKVSEVVSLELDVEDIPELIKALKVFAGIEKKRRLISVQLITGDGKTDNKTEDKTQL